LARLLRKPLQLIVGTKVDHNLTHGMRRIWVDRLHEDQPEGMHGWILYSIDL
jgi:hypothetical protein